MACDAALMLLRVVTAALQGNEIALNTRGSTVTMTFPAYDGRRKRYSVSTVMMSLIFGLSNSAATRACAARS
jgi:hypothetical protein